MVTLRELAVLRLLSVGHQIRETAKLLDLGEETVRSHVKRLRPNLALNRALTRSLKRSDAV